MVNRRVIPNPKLDDTVRWMSKFANKDKDSAEVRGRVEKICRYLVQGDYASEVLACYYWVCQHIRYIKDPTDVEMVQDPIRVMESRAGDCDDMATLLAAMVMACGNEACFSLVGFVDGEGPSHVFACVHASGKWISLDPVANRDTHDMHQRTKVRRDVPVSRRARLAAANGLGGMNLGSSPTVYSVFNYRNGLYTYYRPAEQPDLPASGQMRPARGTTPESLAVVLPEGSTKIGRGKEARGVIATHPDAEGALGDVALEAPAWKPLAVTAGIVGLLVALGRMRRQGRRV